MPKFSFTKLVDIDRDKFFAISTDYERFTEILPEYFLELKIVENNGNTTKIFETLRFLGKTVAVDDFRAEVRVDSPPRGILVRAPPLSETRLRINRGNDETGVYTSQPNKLT